MAANFGNFMTGTFRLSSSDDGDESKLGFSNSPEPPNLPSPPCVEVLPSEVSSSVKYTEESLDLEGLTLLKGRVSTKEVFALSNSDLVPGKYEGGLKLWEGSLDLVESLRSEVGNGHLVLKDKRVLELGCGHGLPGIIACLEGADSVHFQDFNVEVLKFLTIPNITANLQKTLRSSKSKATEVRFFSGDWSEVHTLLPRDYDVVLMAETVYSSSILQRLYELIKKCMSYPQGILYMSAKKHYFGVGGGTREFLSMVEKDGLMEFKMISSVTDGSSNVREVWKLSFKPVSIQ